MDLSTINEMDSIISTQNNDDFESKIDPPKKYFPTDVLKWMKKNASPKMSLKLMQICKYFKHKEFPYFVVKNISADDAHFQYKKLNDADHEWDTIEDIPNNLWITNEIAIDSYTELLFIRQLIPKIAVCEVKVLAFGNELIFFNDFKVLTSSGTVTTLSCYKTQICDESDEIAPFEDILECIPKIEYIGFRYNVPSFSTIEAAKKEWILPNLEIIAFQYIDVDFNTETFVEFMKNHKPIKFILRFLCFSSFDNASKFQEFVDEIISAADLRYPPPDFEFSYQTEESIAALKALKNKHIMLQIKTAVPCL